MFADKWYKLWQGWEICSRSAYSEIEGENLQNYLRTDYWLKATDIYNLNYCIDKSVLKNESNYDIPTVNMHHSCSKVLGPINLDNKIQSEPNFGEIQPHCHLIVKWKGNNHNDKYNSRALMGEVPLLQWANKYP